MKAKRTLVMVGSNSSVLSDQQYLTTPSPFSAEQSRIDMREEGNFFPSYYHQYRIDIGDQKIQRPFIEVDETIYKKPRICRKKNE